MSKNLKVLWVHTHNQPRFLHFVIGLTDATYSFNFQAGMYDSTFQG